MKTYRQHRCTRHHRAARTFLRCVMRSSAVVVGQGGYALIAWCRVPTVTLWDNPADAHLEREVIDRTGCGHGCLRHHEVVFIDLANQYHSPSPSRLWPTPVTSSYHPTTSNSAPALSAPARPREHLMP